MKPTHHPSTTRVLLVAGGNVVLTVLGTTHPPLSIDTEGLA